MSNDNSDDEKITQVYHLQGGEYVGLKVHLEQLNAVLHEKIPNKGCSKPLPGQSLKNGNFLPFHIRELRNKH